MKIKSQRLIAIKNIILTGKIGSQDELRSLLEKEGYVTTQATLSRDMKFLKIAKIPDPVLGYVYTLGDSIARKTEDKAIDDFPMGGVESVEFSGNLAVIKTKPGFANSIASVIDSHDLYETLGTIAGDDTILIISREGVSRSDLINALALFITGIEKKVL